MERTQEISETHRRHPALHIEVLAGDHRIAERRFDHRRTISIGRSLRNTVILADEHAPPSIDLFHRSKDGYALHFTDATHGSVALAAGATIHDLAAMRAAASPHRHGYDLDLDQGAHGRVEVGEETVEFEVVAGPDSSLVERDRSAQVRGFLALAILALAVGLTSFVATRDLPRIPFAVSQLTGWPRRAPVIAPLPTAAAPAPAPAPAAVAPASASSVVAIEEPLTLVGHIARRTPSRDSRSRGATAPTGTPIQISGFHALKSIDVPSLPRAPERLFEESDYTEEGLLEPQALLRGLGEEKGAIAAAYQEALRTKPELAGDLVARITLDPEGRVAEVAIVRDTLGSPEVRQRVDSVLRRWRTALPTAGSATYELPFHFHSTHQSPPTAP